jgi:hypothetical protein
VINLPSEDLVSHVDRLALTTGKSPVPEKKRKWAMAMNRTNSAWPRSLRSGDWPRHRACASVRYQMEGVVQNFRPFGKNVSANVFELHIL